MTSRASSTEAAVCYGAIAGIAVACMSAEVPVAVLVGVAVAITLLVPHNAITKTVHHGRVYEPPHFKRPPPSKVHSPQPTGYHHGAFGRL